MLFAAGFILLWSLGSVIVGGKGFPWTTTAGASISPVALQAQIERPLEPLVDLRAFRDLSYVPVKGIYVTSQAAGNPKALAAMIAIADQTEINAFVIDVKDDYGKITYEADVPLAKDLGLIDVHIRDIDGLIATLREHDITPIARVVAFQDDALATTRPDLAVQSSKGGIWRTTRTSATPIRTTTRCGSTRCSWRRTPRGMASGRSSSTTSASPATVPSPRPSTRGVLPRRPTPSPGSSRSRANAWRSMGVWVSADVFGLTTTVKKDQGIGQQFEKISRNVDIICPMVYPSHYDAGSYGIDSPDDQPIRADRPCSGGRHSQAGGHRGHVPPLAAGLHHGGVQYGVEEVKAQIKAAEEQGYEEWLLWDPSLNYTVGALGVREASRRPPGPDSSVRDYGDQPLRVHVEQTVQRQPQPGDDAQRDEAEHHEGLLEIDPQVARRSFQSAQACATSVAGRSAMRPASGRGSSCSRSPLTTASPPPVAATARAALSMSAGSAADHQKVVGIVSDGGRDGAAAKTQATHQAVSHRGSEPAPSRVRGGAL